MTGPPPNRDDDLAAFYAATCPRLIGLLTAVGGSRSDAEEVAQDAFIRLLARWERVRGYEDPEAWVRAVAVRMLVSRLRRARVARTALRRLTGRRSEHQPAAGPDRVDVAAALRTLSPPHRAVVVLHHALDLPVEQVAAELGVPVGTVKSRLARARTALAPLLRDEEVADHA